MLKKLLIDFVELQRLQQFFYVLEIKFTVSDFIDLIS